MPGDSLMPLLCTVAMTVFFTGALLQRWWITGIAVLAMLLSAIAWLWPQAALGQTAEVSHG
jgi:hypothetical protein